MNEIGEIDYNVATVLLLVTAVLCQGLEYVWITDELLLFWAKVKLILFTVIFADGLQMVLVGFIWSLAPWHVMVMQIF